MVDDGLPEDKRIKVPRPKGGGDNGFTDCLPDSDCLPDLDCLPDCDCSFWLLPSTLLGLIATSAPAGRPRRRTTAPGRAGLVAIRGYQRWLSPHLPTRCRQIPTCSDYGAQAVRRYGLVTGSRLSAARIRRCNPATPRGTYDPVP